LEFAPLKVLGSIPFGVNFGGQVLWLRTGLPQVGGEIGPLGLVDPWIGYRVFKERKKKKAYQSSQHVGSKLFISIIWSKFWESPKL